MELPDLPNRLKTQGHPPAFFENSHSLIAADNLFALRALHAAARDFHFIYIDPPYNSGQNFTFKDSAVGKRSDAEADWLTFMYPRLFWAREVLRDDGVIFVSIDDRQMASLCLMMNEIFGKQNHVGTLKWRKKRKPSFLDSHLSSTIEYILVFAKQKKLLSKFTGEKTEESTRPVLNAGNAVVTRVLRRGTEARCADGVYKKGQYINRTLGIELLQDATVLKNCLVNEVTVQGRFRVSQDILDRGVFVTSAFGLRRHVLPEEQAFKHVSDDCTDWPTNEDAEQEIRKIFGTRVFEYAKPVGLVQNLLAMCTPQDNEFRCLDFFSGSGTLAEAVLAQNALDLKNRTFCCVQSCEPISAGKLAKLKAAPQLGVLGVEKLAHLRSIFDITKARIDCVRQKYDANAPFEIFECLISPSSTPDVR